MSHLVRTPIKCQLNTVKQHLEYSFYNKSNSMCLVIRGSYRWQGQEMFLIPKVPRWALGPPSLLLVLLTQD